ncbi:hypothetical protein JW835_14935 [bacterium]|nr:hypothetical protein [bacterium]
MKIGFGLYHHQLTDENFQFARQCGATHLVVHLVDYFHGQDVQDNQPVGGNHGWGIAGHSSKLWETDSLIALKKRIAHHDLELYAIENFDPSHWYDVILAGPKREEQLEKIIDKGDIDLIRILRILKNHRFTGVLIPDHAPLMSCTAPWHAGMAYTMGYLKAVLKELES